MKKLLFLLLIVPVLLFKNNVNAQKIFTGTIEYELVFSGDIPAMAAAYLPSSMTITINETKCKVVQASSMMSNTIIVDKDANLYHLLISAMGQKYHAQESIDKIKADIIKAEVVDTKDTKTIQGYKCVRKELTTKMDSETLTHTGYFCDEIYNPAYEIASDHGVSHIPLEIETEVSGMQLKMTAVKIKSSKIKDSEFAIPQGYTTISFDDLKSLTGE